MQNNLHLTHLIHRSEGFEENNSKTRPQKLDEHNQHDQYPGKHDKNLNKVIISKVVQPVVLGTFWTEKHTINTLFSSFLGSDEIRQRNTAQVRIRGPASFISKALKLEIIESISWISVKDKVEEPCLRNCTSVYNITNAK